MQKDFWIKELVEARTALLEAVSGLCDDDFGAMFGERCLSLKERLAHIAVVDWDAARAIHDVAQGKSEKLCGISSSEPRAKPVEQRCCAPVSDVVTEAVLSLQALLEELRHLPEEHFLSPAIGGNDVSVGITSVLDETLRCTRQHYQEIVSWRG